LSGWTTAEIRLLRDIFPIATTEELVLAFPRHTISAVRSQARAHGIRRNKAAPKGSPLPHPLVRQLARQRMAIGMTRSECARRARVDRAHLYRMERRSGLPRADTLIRWAKVLDLQLTLTPINPVAGTGEPRSAATGGFGVIPGSPTYRPDA